jgi:uncharacterized protein YukE
MEMLVVESVSKSMQAAIADINHSSSSLNRQISRLNDAWDSPAARDYGGQLRSILQRIDSLSNDMEQLNTALRTEQQQWKDAAQDYVRVSFPIGYFDQYKQKWKDMFSEDVEARWGDFELEATLTEISLAGLFDLLKLGKFSKLLPIVGTLISAVSDVAGGVIDFMQWAIPDWERYETLGEEIAATLVDLYFAAKRTELQLGVDALNLLFGESLGPAADIAARGINNMVDSSFEMRMDQMDESGLKDFIVEHSGKFFNEMISNSDSQINPYIEQLMTASP